MDPLGGYRDTGLTIRLLASAVFVGVLCLVAALERLQYELRETEASRWWASNGRDVLNLFSFAVLGYGLTLLGFFGPMVLLIAGSMVVLLTALQGGLGRTRGANWVSVGLTLGLGLPALLAPQVVARLAQGALAQLAP